MLNYFRIAPESYRLVLKNPMEEPEQVVRPVMGKRDACAFQILLQSDHHYSVQMDPTDRLSVFNWQAGLQERFRVEVRCALPVRMYAEDLHTDDDGLLKADALLPIPYKDSNAHTPTTVYVEMQSDENTAPGIYPVDVLIYASMQNDDETLIRKETLDVEVKNVLLPLPRDFSMDFSLWQHSSNIARQHDTPLWSDAHFAVLENYVKALSDLGQKSITVIVSEIPWRGQSCFMDKCYSGNLYEFSMVRIRKDAKGLFHYDFSVMQRYIDLCRRHGVGPSIEVMGLINVWDKPILTPEPFCPEYPEALRLRYLDEQDGCMKYMRSADAIRDYVRAVHDYFVETDQIDQVFISADEPGDIGTFRHSLNTLRELCPRFRIHVSINHTEFIREFSDQLQGFAPHLSCCLEQYDFLIDYKKQHPHIQLQWYICCGDDFPNHFIRTNPIESRVTGPFTYYMGFDGFGRWAFTCWPHDPRKEVRYSEFEAGDPFLVYPGRDGSAIYSLRYKNLQRGIMDYELLHLAEEKAGKAQVLPLLYRLIPADSLQAFRVDYKNLRPDRPFSLRWTDYNDVKRELLALLEA